MAKIGKPTESKEIDVKVALEKIIEEHKKQPMLQLQSTPPMKLKDRVGRGGMQFNLLQTFGFVPEEIVVQKVQGRNNVIVVSAVLTDKQLHREEKRKNESS